MRLIDHFLNRVTMYRLVLYYLVGLIGAAVLFSFAGVLAYNLFAILFSTAFILAVCAGANYLSARIFKLPANVESSAISALILALIISPIRGYGDLWFLFWASLLAMASKYILNLRGKHLFNPVALGVAVTALTINQSASWWVGTPVMLPFVLVGGLLITRKIRRFKLVWSFMAAALAVTVIGALLGGGPLVSGLASALNTLFLYSPFFFFAFVMLTEPLTTPPTNDLRNLYGALVGLLFAPAFHIGAFYTTPEIALLIGNVFSYLVSPKHRLVLRLKEKRQIAPHAWDFLFSTERRLAFAPGQYMEWNLGHEDPDSRGNRRYFTLASSPTEPDLRLGVRFNDPATSSSAAGSSFKQAMLEMERGDEIIAGQLAGDFTLPQDSHQPLVFIAGGIGITPYRSMVQYLLDTERLPVEPRLPVAANGEQPPVRQRRSITLFYAAPTVRDFVYKNVFSQAERELGMRTIYVADKTDGTPRGWVGLAGRIQPEMIQTYVPGYQKAIFYISGPNAMVDAMKHMLRKLGIPEGQIKTDFFAGL